MILETLQAVGRWAQAKRRGGLAASHAAAGPPPAPLLAWSGGRLIQTAQGEDDSGGMVRLFSSGVSGGPYAEELSDAWAASQDWGDEGSLPMGYLVCAEEGNGIAYNGVSAYSNEIDNA